MAIPQTLRQRTHCTTSASLVRLIHHVRGRGRLEKHLLASETIDV
jgi:hypothetical protein